MHESAEPRSAVVAAALELFQKQGYDQTSVEQIAQAAGVSRSTFFRQFGGKEDVVFADHEVLLAQLRIFLGSEEGDPWSSVCAAAVLVFKHFAAAPEMGRVRYQVVRQIPALRDREIVTVFRYERLFDDHLRRTLAHIDPLDAVGFAASVAATHNHVLRRLLRDGEDVAVATLESALATVRRRYGVGEAEASLPQDDLVVAVFPRAMPIAEITRRLGDRLTES